MKNDPETVHNFSEVKRFEKADFQFCQMVRYFPTSRYLKTKYRRNLMWKSA